MASERDKLHKRCTWLNSNVFSKGAIDLETIDALASIEYGQAMEITRELEDKGADKVKNPSGYLKAAVRRLHEGGGGGGKGGPPRGRDPDRERDRDRREAPSRQSSAGPPASALEEMRSRLHRRCTWLNANVFEKGAINDEALEALMRIGDLGVAMDLLKDLEAKSESVNSPSGYLIGGVRRLTQNGRDRPPPEAPGGRAEPAHARRPPPPATVEDENVARLHKRCLWLNVNVFGLGAINDEALEALVSLGDLGLALDLLNDLEARSKEVSVKSPSGYLIAAVKRESGGGKGGGGGGKGGGGGFQDSYRPQPSHAPAPPPAGPPRPGGGLDDELFSKLHKRCTWLNNNVFSKGAINEDAIMALADLGDLSHAFDILKSLEEKRESVNNPSGWLTVAAKKVLAGDSPRGPPPREQTSNGRAPVDTFAKLQRRAKWLNQNVFDGAINDEAVNKLKELADANEAFQLLDDVEAKRDEIKSPSGYLITAVRRINAGGGASGGGGGGGPRRPSRPGAMPESDEDAFNRIHKRCTWLNTNVFSKGAITDEAMQALAAMDFNRAMDLLTDVHNKGPEKIANPSGYIKTAARRDTQGDEEDERRSKKPRAA